MARLLKVLKTLGHALGALFSPTHPVTAFDKGLLKGFNVKLGVHYGGLVTGLGWNSIVTAGMRGYGRGRTGLRGAGGAGR